MWVNCKNCGDEIYRKPSQIKRSKNHFCGKECHRKWQTGKKREDLQKRIEHNCHYCDSKIMVVHNKYQKFLNGEIKDLFCDKNCLANWQSVNRSGENNPLYSRVSVHCEFCGEEYKVIKSKAEETRFCSSECRIKGRVEDISLACDFCGATFSKKRHKIRDNNFCKKKCSEKWNSERSKRVTLECETCESSYVVSKGREKTSKNCSKKCHYIWLKNVYCQDPKVIERLRVQGAKSYAHQNNSNTKPERILKEYLIDNNIEFIEQLLMYDKFVVDFYLPEYDIIIEVFGDYWHANPLFYGDGVAKKKVTKKQEKQIKKDRAREAYLKKCGHNFHVLWENDIYNNLDKVINFL